MRYIKQSELLFITVIYLIITISLSMVAQRLLNNVINPIFYILITIYCIYILRTTYVRNNDSKYYIFKIFIITIVYLFIFFNLGFIIGFSKSPYSHSLSGIIKNLFLIVLPIIGIELIRGVIIGKNKKNKVVVALITTTLFLLEIKYNTIVSDFNNVESLFKYVSSTILPLIFGSVIYSYLCYKASYKLPLIYRTLEKITLLIIPIYPKINWFITGTIGCILPVVILFLFKYNYFEKKVRKEKVGFNKFAFAISITFAVLLTSFMLGFFKYEPIAILSNSMLPAYSRGDVLIYEKKDDKSLQKLEKGSIIIYRIGEQIIAHRVVEIIDDDGTIKYRTKGDNNESPDLRLVAPDQIEGVYIFHIKYIGYPSVWLSEFFNNEKAVVETK